MSVTNWVRKIGRPLIFPEKEILELISGYRFNRALDIGCGNGQFMDLLIEKEIVQEAVGVEVDPFYWGETRNKAHIVGPDKLTGTFDFLVFNDVLHHIDDKKNFAFDYIDKFCDANGFLLVKEMSPDRVLPRYFNRLHDLILSRQLISEISSTEIKSLMGDEFGIVIQGHRKIFLYDHYYMLLSRTEGCD